MKFWDHQHSARSETRRLLLAFAMDRESEAGKILQKVGVTAQNLTLRAGIGPLSRTVSLTEVAKAIEFGNNPHVKEQAVSKRGKVFTRRRGNRFGPPAKTGHVAYPAARDAIPRIASLWVQTAVRTIHEQIEKVH